MEPYAKLFVVGCPRSGTTWLKRMLAEHPQVLAIPPETYLYNVFYNPFVKTAHLSLSQRLKAAKSLIKVYGLLPILKGFSSEDLWQGALKYYDAYASKQEKVGPHHAVSRADLAKYIQTVRTQYADLSQPEQAKQLVRLILDGYFAQHSEPRHRVLVEKTPINIKFVDVILNSFPEARVVEIIRDGRDVRASYQAFATSEAWARQSTAQVITNWKTCIHCGDRFRQDSAFRDRIHLVRYEELRRHTPLELQKILDFAQLDQQPSVVEQIIQATDISRQKDKGEGKLVNKGDIGTGSRLSSQDLAIIDKIAGSTLQRLGYH
ncbi:sulfotransferase family protein [Almyronema epifaneia]|uniref:Sulfotransferase family protein n=1 Tax=Almyronema epifaneia S1 TaxID=2991925 RepID=A0ABW6IIF4_9CYAN